MESPTPKKWYNKVWLVSIGSLVSFPVNLLILWKNQSIKKGWKVLLFILSPLFTLLAIGLITLAYLGTSNYIKKNFHSNIEESDLRDKTNEPVVFYDVNTALAGVKDPDGVTIIPAKYDYIGKFVNDRALVCRDGKYGYIDKSGILLVPCQFDEAFDYQKEGLIVKKDGKWLFINGNGETLKTLEYDRIYQHDTLYMVRKNELYGYLNIKGDEIIKPEASVPFFFENGLSYFGPFGSTVVFMNTRLKPELMVKGTKSEDFSEGLAPLALDGKVGFINPKGELVIPNEYDLYEKNGYTFLPSFYQNFSCVQKNGKYGFINKKGETVIPFQYDYASNFSEQGYTVVEVNKKKGIIDREGNYLIEPLYEQLDNFYSDDASRAMLNGKYGYIDKTGKVLIPFEYDVVYGFNQGAPFGKKNGKWALLNREGKPVTPFQFEKVYSDFKEGLACVQLNGKYGYINKAGKVMIDYRFDSGENFSEGILTKYTDNERVFYDKKGRVVRVQAD
ncbi:hypothetical protein GCM10028806_32890 [Spirosoma terrae]|uniref:WG repeat-containing protein n=1 Tax=Spirosoma terrae TaxID=1968276 RepID=A0A6L9L8C8_9BACT|nr:WG repeat-containing protein [Spirosoma terrae]NDU95602.1 WG repeat-containing protein [Spirosoma terrae]